MPFNIPKAASTSTVNVEVPDEKRVLLRVRDRGVGIPADGPEAHFLKRFYRVPGRTQFAGERNRPGPFHRPRSVARGARRKSLSGKRRRRPAAPRSRFELPEGRRNEPRPVVEDEEHLAEGLRFNLEAEGYEVAVSSR